MNNLSGASRSDYLQRTRHFRKPISVVFYEPMVRIDFRMITKHVGQMHDTMFGRQSIKTHVVGSIQNRAPGVVKIL